MSGPKEDFTLYSEDDLASVEKELRAFENQRSAELLKQLRSDVGFTQSMMIEATMINKRTYERYETGEVPVPFWALERVRKVHDLCLSMELKERKKAVLEGFLAHQLLSVVKLFKGNKS